MENNMVLCVETCLRRYTLNERTCALWLTTITFQLQKRMIMTPRDLPNTLPSRVKLQSFHITINYNYSLVYKHNGVA